MAPEVDNSFCTMVDDGLLFALPDKGRFADHSPITSSFASQNPVQRPADLVQTGSVEAIFNDSSLPGRNS
jgi:hypothetical protein